MYAKKSLGQHFLKNPSVVAKMVAAGSVAEGDVVFEIGPGPGILTRALLETGATVIAVEADVRAIEILETEFEGEVSQGRLILHHADMRTLDLEVFYTQVGFTHGSFKVLANIPYYISGMLFEKLLGAHVKPSTLVFLVQKEVAERIARSEKESLLSLSVKAYGIPRYISSVARGNFSPPPKVDSAVLLVSDIANTAALNFKEVRETDFFRILKVGLGSKRKQLLGNLSAGGGGSAVASRPRLEEIFTTLNIPLTARGEDLPLEAWLSLTKELALHRK